MGRSAEMRDAYPLNKLRSSGQVSLAQKHPALLPLDVPDHVDVMAKGRWSNQASFNRNHWLYRVLAYFYSNWLLCVCKSFHQRVVCDETPGQRVQHCQ